VVAKPARYQANAVVYLKGVNGKYPPPSKPVHMDQKGMQFEPRVLAVLKGTTVEFLNSDPAEHNIYTPDGEKYDLGKWKQGEKRSYTYGKAGTYTQLCKFHPAMIGYIVVVENPCFALTKQDGSFQIPDVPPGEYTLLVWHERLKANATKVTVEAGKSAEVEIPLAR
jgi:plastocyanin